jgi:ATP-dependent 26S proteasome regulatory subunit
MTPVFLTALDIVQDSLAPKRQSEGSGAGDATAARVLTQLLVEMDGFSASSRVFVLGATNRPEALDPALLRPGRLDALLEVPSRL